MRLVCPNCAAQYEVPESVIPDNGRDVQCSSCGHTWFQAHPSQAIPEQEEEPAEQEFWADESEVAATRPDEDAEDEWEGFPTDPRLTEAPPSDKALVPDPEDPASRLPEIDEDDYEEDPALDMPPARRGLDTSVADLLREEAEREARARAAERAHGLESQPDLGLESASAAQDLDAQRRSEEARQRVARLRGTEVELAQASAPASPPPPPPAQPAAPQATATPRKSSAEDDRIAAAAAAAVAESRRGLLPDIEEINSSLRSTSDRRPARADDHDTPGQTAEMRETATAPKRSFSRGFSVTLLVAMIFLALYVFAPALAEMVPAAMPLLDGYVGAVDDLRVMLDNQVQNLSRWLANIAGSTS
ncbi:MAG: zinc-ribbon domain-containing protein [Paracoccaceae bacterium]